MKYTFSALALLLFSALFLPACRNDNDEVTPITVDSTIILSHKGCGDGPFQHNTLEGAIYGYEHLGGIEIDVQKSRSGTLWLFHNEYFFECNGKKDRLPERTDAQISEYITCKGNGFKMTKLEEIFEHHRRNKINKIISLDIKSWLPTKNSFTQAYLISLADNIADLIIQYEMTEYVLVECENAMFLNRVKKNSAAIPCYLATYGDFNKGMQRALKAGYEGLSFKYDSNTPPSQDMMDELHRKGLKIQFWTIDEKLEITEALKLKPDYLQTNNVLLR